MNGTQVGSTWEKFAGNPVLGRELGTCFDMSLLVESGRYRMWFSWRPRHGIGYAESPDGLHWKADAEVVLDREPNSSSEVLEVTRPFVLREAGGYTMWYAGHGPTHVVICRATSPDGLRWARHGPVLEPRETWEKSSLMCPSVIRDSNGTYRMWYSGGERYEPDAIGYAVSTDGVHWNRVGAGPVLVPRAKTQWERDRVAGAHIFSHDGYLYAAYIGFANDFEDSSIGIARSRDGIHWERHARNPILSRGSSGDFDSINVYKPFVIVEDGLWRVWFNGSSPLVPGDSSPANRIEQIGHAACRFVFEPENADED